MSALPMWVHDSDSGCFLDVNDAAIKCYQWSREEFLATTIETLLVSSDGLEALSKAPPSAFVDGGDHRRKDGSTLRVETNVQEVDAGGRRALLVVAVDVTDRKRAE